MFVYKVIGLFRRTFYLQVENTCIILLIEENYAHKTSITLPLFIEGPVPRQQSVFGIYFTSVTTIFRLDFRNVPKVWYFCFFILLSLRLT
jgi:hypothetical protein